MQKIMMTIRQILVKGLGRLYLKSLSFSFNILHFYFSSFTYYMIIVCLLYDYSLFTI